jgi:hypothetical protein
MKELKKSTGRHLSLCPLRKSPKNKNAELSRCSTEVRLRYAALRYGYDNKYLPGPYKYLPSYFPKLFLGNPKMQILHTSESEA